MGTSIDRNECDTRSDMVEVTMTSWNSTYGEVEVVHADYLIIHTPDDKEIDVRFNNDKE